jgi:hypothetical protein
MIVIRLFILFLIKYVHGSYLLVYQFSRLQTKRASLKLTNAKTHNQIL